MRTGGRGAGAALVVGGVLAGGSAVGIRYSNRELAPLFGAGVRFALAAAVLGVVAAVLRVGLPKGRALAGVAVFGVLNFAGAFGFAYYALTHVGAGVASTLLALTPLMTLLLAAAQHEERIRPGALAGGVIALVGVAFISEASLSGSVPVAAMVAAVASVACFAEAAVVVRRFPPVAPIMTNAIAMGVGAAALLGLSVAVRESWSVPEEMETWIALGYLVLVGSIAVFLLYLFVLRRWEASRAVYFDVLIPPVAVVLSAWLDDESLSAGFLVGGALVLSGTYLGALRRSAS